MQDNFKRSQLRDAVNSQLFYFRKNIVAESKLEKEEGSECSQPQPQSQDHEYELMTTDVIMNGNVCYYMLQYNYACIHALSKQTLIHV